MIILQLMILVMPFEMSPYLQIADSFMGVLPSFTVIKLLGMMGLVWALAEVMSGRVQLHVLDAPQLKAFAVYLGIALLGSLNDAGDLQFSRLLTSVLFLPLVRAAVRTEQDLRTALKTAAAVLIVIFPYAYRQMGRFGGRLGVGLYEANYYGLMLVMMFPVACVFFRQAKTRGERIFWGGGLAIIFVQIILTGSRGAFLAVVVAGLFMGFHLVKRRVLGILLMSAVLLVPIVVLPTTVAQRLTATASSDATDWGTTVSTRIRLVLIENAIDLIKAYPLTGVGLGLFSRYSRSIEDDPYIRGARNMKLVHNTYLEIGAELGIPGLLAFVSVLGFSFVALRRADRIAMSAQRPELRDIAVALQASVIGYAIGAIFISAQYEKFLWLMIFVSVCAVRIIAAAGEPEPQPVPARPLPAPRRTGAL